MLNEDEADYQALTFALECGPDHDAAEPPRQPVVVVGAGRIGLASAIDPARDGTSVLLLDDDRLSSGSRAICFAKRTFEVFDRLGCGEPVMQNGFGWNSGRVFLREEQGKEPVGEDVLQRAAA